MEELVIALTNEIKGLREDMKEYFNEFIKAYIENSPMAVKKKQAQWRNKIMSRDILRKDKD